MSFINKMEHRCVRLGLLDYKLSLWIKSSHSNSLNFELLVNPKDKRIEKLTTDLKVLASLSVTEFLDRVNFTFQGVHFDKYLVDIIKKKISDYDIEFIFSESIRNTEFQRCVCLHQLYDYDSQRWTF